MSFLSVNEISEREIFPGFTGRFVHGDSVSVVYWKIQKGAPLPEHQHEHEQIMNVLTGDIELTVGDVTKILTAGSVAVIPGNTAHSGTVLTDCEIIDVWGAGIAKLSSGSIGPLNG